MIDSILRLAKRECPKSGHKIFRHFAAVVKGGAIIAVAVNRNERHAEVNALNQLWPNKRKNSIVWSIRMTKTGKISNAKPCDECLPYLISNGVKKVYFSTTDGNIECMRL